MQDAYHTGPRREVFCTEYEGMLDECQNALTTWSTRREESWRMGLRGRELGAELVRLQANFAKAYARLQKHIHECPVCAYVSTSPNVSQTPFVTPSNHYGAA